MDYSEGFKHVRRRVIASERGVSDLPPGSTLQIQHNTTQQNK